MPDLSVLITALNEIHLQRTIDDVLQHAEADTEVIVVLDGYWPFEAIPDHDKVTLIHHTKGVGQRAAINEAARIARAPYLMKLDAHCSLDRGFDAKLLKPYADKTIGQDVVTVPRLYNLHAFDWICDTCGRRSYQGPTPITCPDCRATPHHREMIWKPRLNRRTDFARFDSEPHFQYWTSYEKRPESKGQIADVMCCVGACWMVPRRHYWNVFDGLDEAYGSWGSMGIELACKSWLSGGRQVVNKDTWYSHMFRTQGGDFSFPYAISGQQIARAKSRAKDIWWGNKWKRQSRPLSWMLDKFWPVPGWTDTDREIVIASPSPSKGRL
jgi:glycosyltransferase involved in cell wall biosynthesis